MKIIIAPDKFKGSLTSFQACEAIRQGLVTAGYKGSIITLPFADGGDGFSYVLQHYLKTTTIQCNTFDPLLRPITAHYQWSENEKTGIVELAVASGIALLKNEELDPMIASTYGTGVLINDALKKGAKKIILGIGGSATNDAGLGILSALGFIFFDKQQHKIENPSGKDLQYVVSIQKPVNLPPFELQVCCDVTNPFSGPNGAACIYGPQKGADSNMVKILDDGLHQLAIVLETITGISIGDMPGAGAAGGVAGGLVALLNARLTPGIDVVMNISNIRDYIPGAKLIITGEGRLDDQSLQGKVVGTIASLAADHQIPCIAFCGKLDLSPLQISAAGLQGAWPISDADSSIQESILHAFDLLKSKTSYIAPQLF